MSSVFSHFLSERSFKSRQNPRVDFFSGKKRLRRIQNGVLSFVVDGLFTTPVYSPRRGRFVNSAFSNKKILAQKSKFIYDKQIERKFYVSSKQEKE